MWKDFCNDISSPYRTLHNWGLSTPSEFAPFKTHHIRPSANSLKIRRTRQLRNTIKEKKGTTFKQWWDQKTETTAKSIQSIKVYKGPIAKAFSINTASVYPTSKNKNIDIENNSKNSSLVIESKNLEPIKNFTLLKFGDSSPITNYKPLRNSTIVKDYSKWVPNLAFEKPIELYKAHSLLPGTSNLRISQDIPKNYFRGSYHTLESPFSSSTRSSLKRAKLLENPIANFSTTIQKRNTINPKTRNFDGYKTANQSIKLLTTKKPVQKQIKKLVVHRKVGQQDKVVITTQVDLDRNSNEVKAYNSLPNSVKSSNKQKWNMKVPETAWLCDTKSFSKSSINKSKMLSIKIASDNKPKMLSKKSSSPLFPTTEKGLKKAYTLKA